MNNVLISLGIVAVAIFDIVTDSLDRIEKYRELEAKYNKCIKIEDKTAPCIATYRAFGMPELEANKLEKEGRYERCVVKHASNFNTPYPEERFVSIYDYRGDIGSLNLETGQLEGEKPPRMDEYEEEKEKARKEYKLAVDKWTEDRRKYFKHHCSDDKLSNYD